MSGIRDGGFGGDRPYPAERPVKMTEKRKKLYGEIGGYAGMALLQAATLPSIIHAIIDPVNADLPPLSMVLMVWIGLILYFVRALVQKDKLYLISNGIGVVLNFILLNILIFGGF